MGSPNEAPMPPALNERELLIQQACSEAVRATDAAVSSKDNLEIQANQGAFFVMVLSILRTGRRGGG